MVDLQDPVLSDIRKKIERERNILLGASNLKKKTNNAAVIQKCNTSIREAQQNIEYLEETLNKLSLQKTLEVQQEKNAFANANSTNPYQQQGRNQNEYQNHQQARSQLQQQQNSLLPPHQQQQQQQQQQLMLESQIRPSTPQNRVAFTRLELCKYDCPSLGHRIQSMLQQLEFRIQVEEQYLMLNEKISKLYQIDGDRQSTNKAESGRLESAQKILLLKKALKRYQSVHVDIVEVTKDTEILNTPTLRKKTLSGTLTVGLSTIRDVDHIASPTFSRKPECFISLKIDGIEVARTKGSRNDRWNEEFNIKVDKGNELEITVYDKSGNQFIPVAVSWFLISDIAEEIRKKKLESETLSAGWMSASRIQQTQDRSNRNSSPTRTGGGSIFLDSPPKSDSSNANGSNGNNSGSSSSNLGPVVSNNWFILEPAGQILVTFGFTKTESNRKEFAGGLGRHGAIRQRKQEVYEQHGHKFVQKQFYNVMCCALCGDFLRYTGYQCQDCKLLCHKKCYQKIVTKCISKSSSEIDPDEAKLNHRIPHRFEPVSNRGTKWCCHCGYILPWSRKTVRKCTECGIMCHSHCIHLVPDFCGMSLEMANKILTTIKSTKGSTANAVPRLELSRNEISSSSSSTTVVPGKTSPAHTRYPSMDPYLSHGKELPPVPQLRASEASTPLESRFSDSPVYEKSPYSINYDEEEADLSYLDKSQTYDSHFTSKTATTAHEQLLPSTVSLNEDELQNPFGAADPYQTVRQSLAPAAAAQPPVPQPPVTQPPAAALPPAASQKHQAPAKTPQQSPRHHQHQHHRQHTLEKKSRRLRKLGLDDFQFLAVLGAGNFGKVMLAESRHTSKLCAIKVLKKDFIIESDEIASTRSEKRVFLIANKERHPFLLNLHCCFQTENRVYFVMEYISGGDLMHHVQCERFTEERAQFYAAEILLGLKYLHDSGVIYRDLKLDNILLTVEGHIKLADYGLCKEGMWYGKSTSTFCGTPEFMAPEILDEQGYGRAVDWWAFGVLLYQMLCNRSPFNGEDEDDTFASIQNDEARYPVTMTRDAVYLLQGLLTKDPAQRLGGGERDALDIMEHSYFANVNFDDILNLRVTPPFIPEIRSARDLSNFDSEFTSETPRLTPVNSVLDASQQEQFRGFSYTSGDEVV